MAVVSSAANLLAQLDEDDEALRLNALQSLNNVVHDFWFQIASSIALVEAFYEDETFTHRELAALVASKVTPIVPHAKQALCTKQIFRGKFLACQAFPPDWDLTLSK